ncbi:MAG: alpha/beta hydrolase [Candidatus Thermoplasmatota archaeon]|jgi:pimeloyl-ACP methyl ester carboxylesterase|nr:alpha/beta hydrolase [Candidatus Thermoplasmatota archaeon]
MSDEIKQEYMQFNNGTLFHRKLDTGARKNIILLHGWSFTSRNWKDVGAFQHLGDLGFNVYAPDYPGFGNSDPQDRYTIKRGDISRGTEFVRDYMGHIGLKNAYLLGASMGGGMAVMAALDIPDMVDGIIAVAPAWVEDQKDRMAGITKPVLFIWGSNDNVVMPSLGQQYSSIIKGSRLEIVQDAPHPVYIDQPIRFFSIVSDFLRSH